MALKADNMLTLTFRENVTDFDHARECWAEFNRCMRRKFGSRWQFVMVLERQQRGAWHIHAAVSGYWPIQQLRPIWKKVTGSLDGGINLSYKGRIQPWKMAAYLTKYLTKSMDTLGAERKRYSSSRGIQIDTEQYDVKVNPRDIVERMMDLIAEAMEVEETTIGFLWVDPDTALRGWACSWSWGSTSHRSAKGRAET